MEDGEKKYLRALASSKLYKCNEVLGVKTVRFVLITFFFTQFELLIK